MTDFPASPLHFIIADDEQRISAVIARVITRIYPGSVITQVHTGKAALRVYEQHGADCLVTDYHMPEMDGLELISIVREQDSVLPILCISAAADALVNVASVDNTLFLVKPFTIDQIVTALTALLANFSMR